MVEYLLMEMSPKQAWKWLELGNKYGWIQEAQTPRRTAFEAAMVLWAQLFEVKQEQAAWM